MHPVAPISDLAANAVQRAGLADLPRLATKPARSPRPSAQRNHINSNADGRLLTRQIPAETKESTSPPPAPTPDTPSRQHTSTSRDAVYPVREMPGCASTPAWLSRPITPHQPQSAPRKSPNSLQTPQRQQGQTASSARAIATSTCLHHAYAPAPAQSAAWPLLSRSSPPQPKQYAPTWPALRQTPGAGSGWQEKPAKWRQSTQST